MEHQLLDADTTSNEKGWALPGPLSFPRHLGLWPGPSHSHALTPEARHLLLQINKQAESVLPTGPLEVPGVARVPLGVPGRLGTEGRGVCLKTPSVATAGLDTQALRLCPQRLHSPQSTAVLNARSLSNLASVYVASHPESFWNNRGYKHRWKNG